MKRWKRWRAKARRAELAQQTLLELQDKAYRERDAMAQQLAEAKDRAAKTLADYECHSQRWAREHADVQAALRTARATVNSQGTEIKRLLRESGACAVRRHPEPMCTCAVEVGESARRRAPEAAS